MQVNRNTHTT